MAKYLVFTGGRKQIFEVVAVIISLLVLALGSCGGSGGTFTLTDIPSKYNGKYAILYAEGDDYELAGIKGQSEPRYYFFSVPISNGKAVIPLWIVKDDDYEFTKLLSRYSGSDDFAVLITISDKHLVEAGYEGDLAAIEFEYVTFKNGSVKKSFKDADDIEENYDKGKWTYSNGNSYEGEMLYGEFHGKGKYTYSNGDVYEGDWVDGKSHGKGKYTWASGNMYEGDWVDDKRDGKGKYTYEDGEVFEGEYVDDKRHGRGKTTFTNGKVEEGYWRNGEFVDN